MGKVSFFILWFNDSINQNVSLTSYSFGYALKIANAGSALQFLQYNLGRVILIKIIAGVNHKKPHHPSKVQVKAKEHLRMPLCLQPVRLTHSSVPFVPRFTISFIHLTSFSTPRVSVSCLTPTISQPTATRI